MTQTESPFACDMTAIAEAQRGKHAANISKLFRAVVEVQEIADGYRFRFANSPEILNTAAEFIALERLCCPFFGFQSRGRSRERRDVVEPERARGSEAVYPR